MNTPVSFKIKQLLYDKGWRYELGVDETGYRVKHSLAKQRWNEGDLTYVNINISEVIMWLYEKHGIWISVKTIKWNYEYNTIRFNYNVYKFNDKSPSDIIDTVYDFNSPKEAYLAAIEYTLTKLV